MFIFIFSMISTSVQNLSSVIPQDVFLLAFIIMLFHVCSVNASLLITARATLFPYIVCIRTQKLVLEMNASHSASPNLTSCLWADIAAAVVTTCQTAIYIPDRSAAHVKHVILCHTTCATKKKTKHIFKINT